MPKLNRTVMKREITAHIYLWSKFKAYKLCDMSNVRTDIF